MNNEQFKALIYGALGFLVPQIIIWLAFALYLMFRGKF